MPESTHHNVNELPTAAQVGGKAAVLLELRRAGFPVPDFCVSPANLEEALHRLGTPIAVRSSGTAEDGGRESFAGQFESFLNLNTLDEVRLAVDRCRASARTDTVAAYCRHAGIDPSTLRMEVILQRFIQPQLAGVAFSVNPVTGAEEVVIEAVVGVANRLLQGLEHPLPPDHALVRHFGPEIEALVRRVEKHMGCPQDVEFAVTGCTVYLLQARPITRIGFSRDVGEWTNADFRDGGVSSGVCTPLMWSLYDLAFQASLPVFLRDIGVLHGDFQAAAMFFGRPYWNLGGVKTCLARLPGFVERKFDEDLNVAIRYEGPGVTTPVNLCTLLRAVPIMLAVPRVFRRQESAARRFLDSGFDTLEKEFEAVPLKEPLLTQRFGELIQRAYIQTETSYFRTIYCESIASLLFTDSFSDAEFAALASGLPALRHMAPIEEMRALARQGRTDLTDIIRKYRHHSRRELDIRVPRWDEEPEFVATLFESTARSPAGQEVRARYESARAAALARLSWRKRRSFARKLDRMRRFLWLREEMRDCSSRMYYLIRRYALQIAAVRGLGEEVFFMTWRQILADDRSAVSEQRERYERYRNFAAPTEVGSRFVSERVAAAASALKGIAASCGRAEGVARVVKSIEEAARVEANSILVCPFTDPGWTPVLGRVAAVVTETGGLLSHAAVVCREYGIPAVLAVPDATRRIRDGAFVVVDGDRGTVEPGGVGNSPARHA